MCSLLMLWNSLFPLFLKPTDPTSSMDMSSTSEASSRVSLKEKEVITKLTWFWYERFAWKSTTWFSTNFQRVTLLGLHHPQLLTSFFPSFTALRFTYKLSSCRLCLKLTSRLQWICFSTYKISKHFPLRSMKRFFLCFSLHIWGFRSEWGGDTGEGCACYREDKRGIEEELGQIHHPPWIVPAK